MVNASMKLKDTPWKKSYDKPRQCIKKQRHHFANKDLYSQNNSFSSSHMNVRLSQCEELMFSNCSAGGDS